MLDSQTFDVTEDQPHPYWSIHTVKPTSSTQPNEPEFTAKPSSPNKELSPYSEDEDKVLHNQPQEDHEEEAESVSPITIVPLYYMLPHMHNFEESNFVVSEYSHSLDHEEVQHPVETLFEGMHFLTKEEVQHALH